MPINQQLLPEWDQEMASLRKALERVPADKFSWKPHDKSWTFIQLASHLANLPAWASMTMNQEEFDMAAPFDRPAPPQTTEALLAELDKNVSEARNAIASAQDSDFQIPWSLKNGGHTIFTMPRLSVLRTVVMNHIIHHRGQLTVYLRLNDIPVPGLYGPSADES